jgi:hypothetical protein
MASIVSAGTTSATALNMSADTTGILQLASNNGTVGLTIDTSQNVGIGTASPLSKLNIGANDGTAYSASSSTGQAGVGATIQLTNLATSANAVSQILFNMNNDRVINRIVSSYTSTTDGYLAFVTEGAGTPSECMRINSSGYVTQPFQPIFQAFTTNSGGRWSAGQTIGFDNTYVNTSSSYSTSTFRFTAPVAGTYHFHYQIYTSAVSTSCRPLKNGADLTDTFWVYATASGVTISEQFSLPLAASDYIEIQVYAGQVSGDYSNFGGFLQS